MALDQIRGLGTGSAPLAYTVPGGQEIILNTLFASFNGAGAASTWFPCIRITAPGGGVVAEYLANSSVAAGASADVTFAPFLRGAGTGGTSGGGTTTTIADISFVAAGTEAEGSTISTLNVNVPAGVQFHDLLVAVFGFEGVAAGSGPYISDTGVATGWSRILSQAPVGGSGTGIEIWAAVWETGSFTPFNFFAAQTVVAREVAYRNTAITVATAITASSASAVAGDNPVAPTVTTTVPKSWVLPAVADALSGGVYTFPGTYTKRFENARGGISGNAEIAIADKPLPVPGASGTVTITATTVGGTARGATATLAVAPLVTTSTGGTSLIGLTAYTPAVDTTLASSNPTSQTGVDTANGFVFFTVPSSGNVLIRLSTLCNVNNTTGALYFGLLEGVTTVSEGWAEGDGAGAPANPVAQRKTVTLYVSGLTPGTIKTYVFGYRLSNAATTATLFAGPTFGPLVMEVWQAP